MFCGTFQATLTVVGRVPEAGHQTRGIVGANCCKLPVAGCVARRRPRGAKSHFHVIYARRHIDPCAKAPARSRCGLRQSLGIRQPQKCEDTNSLCRVFERVEQHDVACSLPA